MFRLHWPVFAVLLGTVACLLVMRRAGNIGFYSLLLLAAIAGVGRLRPAGYRFSALLREYWPLHLAMAGMVLAIFINQLVLQNFVIKTYDYPSRMFFFAVLLWVTLLLPYGWMKQLQWAYVAGALAAAVHMYVTTQGGTFRGYVYFMPIIELAQMSQLLGFFALLTIGYEVGNRTWRRIGIALKLLAGAAGIYAAYLSQTRGAWLSIPVCVLIAAVILGRRISRRRMLALVAALLLLLTALFASSSLVHQRVDEVRHDLTQYYEKANPVTSVGVRLQLWAGSWLLFLEHPAVGVGREGYSAAMLELERRGILTPESSHQPHSHNEILYNMVTLGSPGLLAILCLYLVPGAYFLRAAGHADREIRVTAGMGLILCSGFLIQGLTDVMFMWGASDNFYAIFAAILFAFIIRRKTLLQGN
ncbi:MAG: O-antigen ligase family protein [Burkholderiaceae bacterium]